MGFRRIVLVCGSYLYYLLYNKKFKITSAVIVFIEYAMLFFKPCLILGISHSSLDATISAHTVGVH